MLEPDHHRARGNSAALAVVVVLLLATLASRREAAAAPPCDFGARRPPVPCDDGRGWVLLLGPSASYRWDGASRGDVGGELSLLTGRLENDGAHTNLRGLTYGGVVHLGYLTGVGGLRASLEAQISYPFGQRLGRRLPTAVAMFLLWQGVSAGPSLIAADGEGRGGFSATLWTGSLIILFVRTGHESRFFIETGAMLKFPIPLPPSSFG